MLSCENHSVCLKPPIKHGQFDKMAFLSHVSTSGSISAAAEHYNISIPTGSRWISELEKELGLKLIKRNGPQISLTQNGEYVVRKISEITDSVHQIKHDIESFASEPSGSVRICCTPVFASKYILPVISDFTEKYPKIIFDLEVDPYGLESYQRYDIVISALCSYDERLEKDILKVKKNIINDPILLVANQDYIEKHGTPEKPSDLNAHRCLYARSLTKTREWAFKTNDHTELIHLNYVLEVSDCNLLLEAALLGMGVAYLPKHVVCKEIEAGTLQQLMPEVETSKWRLNMYYEQTQHIDLAAELFKDHFRTYIGKYYIG